MTNTHEALARNFAEEISMSDMLYCACFSLYTFLAPNAALFFASLYKTCIKNLMKEICASFLGRCGKGMGSTGVSHHKTMLANVKNDRH